MKKSVENFDEIRNILKENKDTKYPIYKDDKLVGEFTTVVNEHQIDYDLHWDYDKDWDVERNNIWGEIKEEGGFRKINMFCYLNNEKVCFYKK